MRPSSRKAYTVFQLAADYPFSDKPQIEIAHNDEFRGFPLAKGRDRLHRIPDRLLDRCPFTVLCPAMDFEVFPD